MKKSDLTRRARRVAENAYKVYIPDEIEAHAQGFEAGYRAARADLRQVMKAAQISHANRRGERREMGLASMVGSVWQWLKPIR